MGAYREAEGVLLGLRKLQKRVRRYVSFIHTPTVRGEADIRAVLASRPAIASRSRPAPPCAGGGRDVTAQGSATAPFQRAVEMRNLFMAEMALREIRQPPLALALEYVVLLAEMKPEKAERAAVRWHGRLEVEATFLTLAELHLALAALASVVAGDTHLVEILRRLVRRVATHSRRFGETHDDALGRSASGGVAK